MAALWRCGPRSLSCKHAVAAAPGAEAAPEARDQGSDHTTARKHRTTTMSYYNNNWNNGRGGKGGGRRNGQVHVHLHDGSNSGN